MSREWVDDRSPFPLDKRWVMRCDETGCATKSEPSVQQPPLDQFVAAGWFIGKTFGDICPACLAAGIEPRDTPHQLMPEVIK
ncbi:hypothetical protein SAMN04489740_2729 [Arthrobacter alpinus]|uniref:Uncharacterized protein n=1 Tax=Arthrobacter alpinus TaxID=656366 RepID=A0A1H5M2X1_9MICC|nr:hypothetical protein [Arthrobacter alpinus]SEE83719.1 hypothetical protein SAMN04489740_2729 [Arthrobacter alpinus]